MKVKDVFKEIFTGYNMNNSTSSEDYTQTVNFINKNSIQYTNIIKDKLINKKINTNVKFKYYMQERDIIISLKKPHKVGTYRKIDIWRDNEKVIIPNNFVILRGIDTDKYSYIFLANYLENIGIDKYIEEKSTIGELKISDIENIELPDISKEKQMTITNLLNNINDRSTAYELILKNDEDIKKYVLNEVIGEENDK